MRHEARQHVAAIWRRHLAKVNGDVIPQDINVDRRDIRLETRLVGALMVRCVAGRVNATNRTLIIIKEGFDSRVREET